MKTTWRDHQQRTETQYRPKRLGALARRGIAVLIVIYGLSIIAAVLLSAAYVDEAFSIKARQRLSAAGCTLAYPTRPVNLLNVFAFYTSLDYWLADYRVSQNILNEPRCLQELFQAMREYGRVVDAAVVGGKADVVFVIRRGSQ